MGRQRMTKTHGFAPAYAAANALPYNWRAMAAGLAAVVFGGGLCLILGLHYLQARPLDLAPATVTLADEAVSLLAVNGVNVEPVPVESRREDDGTTWTYAHVEAQLPEGTGLEHVENLLRQRFQDSRLAIARTADGEHTRTLALAFNNRVFLNIDLQAARPPRPARLDLAAGCERIAQDVRSVVEAQPGVARATLHGPVWREDETAFWQEYALDVTWSGRLSLGALQEALESRMGGRNTAIEVQRNALGAALAVRYEGRVCATLEIPEDAIQSDMAPAPAERPVEVPPQDQLPLESIKVPDPQWPNGGVSAGPPRTKRVAIVVDDGGYGGEHTTIILGLDPRLTLAILPFCPKSESIAREATDKGFEVIVHMPMESENGNVAFPGELKTDMTPDEIIARMDEALATVPGAVGINNHQGSKFTSSAEPMRTVLGQLHDRGLFFVDSVTAASSVAYTLAKELGVPTARRHVFLDNESDPGYIRRQFSVLFERAEKRGDAIGICHFRNNTAKILAEVLPELDARGIELVPVSELLH